MTTAISADLISLSVDDLDLLLEALEIFEREYHGAHQDLDAVKWQPVKRLASRLDDQRVRLFPLEPGK